MSRTTHTLPRIVGALALIATVGSLAGCTDPSRLVRPVSPSSIIIIGGHPIVFSAQLRAIGNPDVKTLVAVESHLQLKLDATEAGGFVIDWKLDPSTVPVESSNLLGGGIYMIQDSEDFPSPEDVALLYLLPPEDPLGGGNRLEGSVAVSEELADRLVADPGSFTAVFFIAGGGAIAGNLQLGGPDTSTR